jgi:hypothetical protein
MARVNREGFVMWRHRIGAIRFTPSSAFYALRRIIAN